MAIDGSGSAGQVAYWVDVDTLSGSDDHFWDNTNSFLGVGTASPDCPLHVIRDGTPIDTSANDVAVFQFNNATSDSAYVRIIAGTAAYATLYLAHSSNLNAAYISYDTTNDELEIAAGKVGIGVNSPNEKLEVSGKVRTNDKFNVSGTDGITQVVTIQEGVRTHTLTFTGGILTSYTVL
jgi:hypothetical protein